MTIAEARLYLTASGELVEEGDLRAAFLFCSPGDELVGKEAEMYKANYGIKAQTKAEDKAMEPGENKSAARKPAKKGRRRRPAPSSPQLITLGR